MTIKGTVHGRSPSPRALLWGWDDQPETLERLAALFPTAAVIASLDEIRQEEYDIIVSDGHGLLGVRSHLFAVAFGGDDFGIPLYKEPIPRFAAMQRVVYAGRSIAREFVVPDEVREPLAGLVRSQLLPAVNVREGNAYLGLALGTNVRPYRFEQIAFSPFLATTEPEVLAAAFVRFGNESVCWAFADEVPDPVPWVAAAIEEWREIAPERFPTGPRWFHGPAWRTSAEEVAAAALDEARAVHEAALQAAQQAVSEAEGRLASARAQADASLRRLLTAQGDDLVAAVMHALESVGFKVRDMDREWPEGDKLEDLRVQDPDAGGWEAIVEVRGYARGAAQGDLLRITARFLPRYVKTEGRAPDAAWYIVNHFIKQDPATRPAVLAANAAEVEIFADGAATGVVIDSVHLFDLCRAVERGDIAPEDARRRLREARGMFTLPPISR